LAQRAHGVAHVLKEIFQPARAASVAAIFFYLLGAAEF
jgi:hypothetical protein